MTDLRARPHEVGMTHPLLGGRASQPSLRAISVSTTTDARARAFRSIYDAQVAFVWRNLRRLGVNECEADDRTQEVFVVAYRRFHEFEERGHGPRAWLFQIVLRVASGARRHQRRHPEVPDGNGVIEREIVDATQTEAVERSEQLSRLDAALETIPLERRAVLVLHEIEEMTAPEIAHVVGVPLNTVYSRLRVARLELEQALARRGVRDE